MEKEIEIIGYVYPEKQYEVDVFEDIFIKFIEDCKWSFGGGLEYLRQNNTYKIEGCIIVNNNDEKIEVEKQIKTFAKANNLSFDFKFSEIIDGYYMNEDGSRGRHVLDQDDQ